jgi:hypothetical protein
MSRHPSTENLARYLEPNPNLPKPLYEVAVRASVFAKEILDLLPQDGPELTAGLRKLLEAKDCFVRAALDLHPPSWTDRC